MKPQTLGLLTLSVTLLIGIIVHYYLRQANFRVIYAKTPQSSTHTATQKSCQSGKINFPIDINTASFEELVALPRIGPSLAQRILNYRTKYGKFSCKKDLLQIKGIGESTLRKIDHLIYIANSTQAKILPTQVKVKLYLEDKPKSNQVKVKSHKEDQTKLIDINTAGVEQLTRLPGIGKVKAQAIVEWRQKHGSFTDINQLTNVKGIGEKTLTKIIPYITIQNYSTSTTDADQPLTENATSNKK